MIRNYFYSFDGNSSLRVSREIFKIFKKKRKREFLKLSFYRIKQIIKKTLMINHIIESSYLKNLQNWDHSKKSYTKKDIKLILKLLDPKNKKKIAVKELSVENKLLRSISLENV